MTSLLESGEHATVYRTHECGHIGRRELPAFSLYGIGKVGEHVRVSGWVNSVRDHGELVFIDLRDRTGIVQLVVDPSHAANAHAIAESLKNEYCVMATGHVVERAHEAINPNLPTGYVEIKVDELEVLSSCGVLPFQLDEENVDEQLRMKWRFLDLRRQKMYDNLELRSRVTQTMRRYLEDRGFLEIETPILTKSTPEGARDFLVPSRNRPGQFFALPQSPQLFKQLLMVSGMERYYQVARCFRDEDLRADRQLEFTQLDIEMSFISQEDILELMEGLFVEMWSKLLDHQFDGPFPRLAFADAMLRFGSDKPDLRYDLEIVDLGEAWAGTEFGVARGALDSGGAVRVLRAPGGARFSRKDMDELTEFAKQWGAKGLAWFIVEEDASLRSPVVKFLSDAEQQALLTSTGAQPGDAIFLMADRHSVVCRVLGALRTHLIELLELAPNSEWAFCWIVDPPCFDEDEETGGWTPNHHPFTAPTSDTVHHLAAGDLGQVVSQGYDIVLNGWELGSGSIRIHDQDVQEKVFEVLGLSQEQAEEKFSFLLRALRMGAPPHGGVAVGLERIVALLAGATSIREVVAFPRMQNTFDPMTESPSLVDDEQLRELHVRTVVPPPKS